MPNRPKQCARASPKCTGELWQCKGCGRVLCEGHSHMTGLGSNVECPWCERARTDAMLLEKPDVVARIGKKADPGDRLNIRDK